MRTNGVEMMSHLLNKNAGNIKLNFSKETNIDFNGNQDIKMELVPYQNSTKKKFW